MQWWSKAFPDTPPPEAPTNGLCPKVGTSQKINSGVFRGRRSPQAVVTQGTGLGALLCKPEPGAAGPLGRGRWLSSPPPERLQSPGLGLGEWGEEKMLNASFVGDYRSLSPRPP